MNLTKSQQTVLDEVKKGAVITHVMPSRAPTSRSNSQAGDFYHLSGPKDGRRIRHDAFTRLLNDGYLKVDSRTAASVKYIWSGKND